MDEWKQELCRCELGWGICIFKCNFKSKQTLLPYSSYTILIQQKTIKRNSRSKYKYFTTYSNTYNMAKGAGNPLGFIGPLSVTKYKTCIITGCSVHLVQKTKCAYHHWPCNIIPRRQIYFSRYIMYKRGSWNWEILMIWVSDKAIVNKLLQKLSEYSLRSFRVYTNTNNFVPKYWTTIWNGKFTLFNFRLSSI